MNSRREGNRGMILVRAMQTEDVDAVAVLEAQIFSMPWSRQGFLDSLQREDTVFLVAEEDGLIVGYIGMYVALDEGEITNVAVSAEMRRRGIGELLVGNIIKEANERGLERVILEVRVSNENAIRLYERNGFKNQGVRKGFYDLPKEDAYIMMYGQ